MVLTQNHFELFELPVSFEIDQQHLAERYRELQRMLHPDRYANATDRERRLSVQHAAQVNEAYRTLKNPLNRARYILELRGVGFSDEHDMTLDSTFLMEQMELRESLSEVHSAGDPLQKLTEILDDIRVRTRAMETQLQQLLDSGAEQDLDAARQIVQKMQFFRRLQQEAEETEEELVNSL